MAAIFAGFSARRRFAQINDEAEHFADHSYDGTHIPAVASSLATAGSISDNAIDNLAADDAIRDWWRRCSGLHTVEDWVINYKKHPAGWGALLMIHGVRCPQPAADVCCTVSEHRFFQCGPMGRYPK